jgi:hypothetical protein
MRTMTRALLVLAAVVLLVGVMPASAQDRPAQDQPGITQGQLLRVDAAAKTFSIRTSQGPMQFIYTDDTKVVGADESVAGLATMAGNDVTVHYTKKQQDNLPVNVATQIEVLKKQ